jgi:uncharacterized membrane protein
MPSKLVMALIGSVALNAALLGVVAGRFASPTSSKSVEPLAADTKGVRPVSAEVQAAWAKLPDGDRKALNEQFGHVIRENVSYYSRMGEAARRVAEIAHAEPFNKVELQNAVVVYRSMQQAIQRGVDDVLISHLAKMPSDARETAARGLLTPYNQWMRPPRPPEARNGEKPQKPAPKESASPAGDAGGEQ